MADAAEQCRLPDRDRCQRRRHREILGLDVCSAESLAGWLTFFRGLTARGPSGVSLVTSDAHPGLVAAVSATLAGASSQRCRSHYYRDATGQHHSETKTRLVDAERRRAEIELALATATWRGPGRGG